MIGKTIISKLIIGVFACSFMFNGANAQQVLDGKRFYDRAKGETPSHLPVPRFVSLKYNKINGRAGPDEDYPVKFIYHRQGLPVKVIAETDEWRKIQDPDGTTVWVHKRMLDARRTLMIRPNGANSVILRDKPRDDSKAIANLANGVVGEIIEQTPGWCRIKVGGYKGWIRAVDAYGA